MHSLGVSEPSEWFLKEVVQGISASPSIGVPNKFPSDSNGDWRDLSKLQNISLLRARPSPRRFQFTNGSTVSGKLYGRAVRIIPSSVVENSFFPWLENMLGITRGKPGKPAGKFLLLEISWFSEGCSKVIISNHGLLPSASTLTALKHCSVGQIRFLR